MTSTRFRSSLAAAALLATAPLAAQRAPATMPTNLPAEVLSLACAPSLAYAAPPVRMRVTGGVGSGVAAAGAGRTAGWS